MFVANSVRHLKTDPLILRRQETELYETSIGCSTYQPMQNIHLPWENPTHKICNGLKTFYCSIESARIVPPKRKAVCIEITLIP